MRKDAGVTLIEMIVVVALIALLIGITFPALATSIESLRLRSSSDDVAAALNAALTRARRQQDAVDVTVSPSRHAVIVQAIHSDIAKTVDLAQGVEIAHVLPAPLGPPDDNANAQDRHFFIYPDGSVPNIAIDLVNKKGFHRLVSVDPITGIAREAEGAPSEP
jgi:prepilin-type N-terminal cleavage/methylation domain-containing protein